MLLQVHDFISPEDCLRLLTIYDQCAAVSRTRDFSEYPVIYWNHFRSIDEMNSLTLATSSRIVNLLKDLTTEQLFPETILLTGLGPGETHPPHADNCKVDKNGEWIPNHTPWRAYSSIVYLNSDFKGGEITVRPRAGLLVAFPSGRNYVHEVLPVQSGIRYTLPIWFTREREHSI